MAAFETLMKALCLYELCVICFKFVCSVLQGRRDDSLKVDEHLAKKDAQVQQSKRMPEQS